MVHIGYHCPHEQYSPSQLLAFSKRAVEAGFEAAMCSDHFNPWLPSQGQSGYTWSWLGAALQATNLSFGTVCAPGYRYHPAIVAQAVATLCDLYPDRFWLAVGSGEALNEHITGEAWPPKNVRHDRLRECVDIMRALWKGEEVTSRSVIKIDRARLYTLPPRPPLLLAAALSEETARWAGSWADGLITCSNEPALLGKIVNAFQEGGGEGKPIYLQSAVSYAASEALATESAFREWPQAALTKAQLADLETPEDFEKACAMHSKTEICKGLRISSDIGQHLEWIHQDLKFGFEAIYLHNLGRNQQEFIDVFGETILPVFNSK